MTTATAKMKLPFGFYICALSFTFERAAYYSAKFLIYVFLTAAIVNGGLGISQAEAAIMQSYLVGFTYLAPIIGGFISDRWIGARYTIPAGLFLMGIGYSLGYIATSSTTMYAMIALVSIGTAFFKGNTAAIVGQLFKDQKMLDSAFSILYSFVNVGSFIGTTLIGVLYLTVFAKNGVLGFAQCFLVAGAFCVAASVWFVFGWRFLGDIGKRPFKESIVDTGTDAEEYVDVTKNPLTANEKKKVLAIILVSTFSIIFWLFWYLSYLSVYDYASKFVSLDFGGFEIPLSWFDSVNALTCIILGPVLAAVWLKLAARPKGDMSLFKKTGLGMLLLGVSFIILIVAEIGRGPLDTDKISVLWIALFAVVLSTGEMCFSPLGNSFVSKYAPKRLLGVLMGVWTFATFVAGIGYGFVYAIVLSYDMMTSYTAVAAILVIASLLLFIFDKKLNKLVEDSE